MSDPCFSDSQKMLSADQAIEHLLSKASAVQEQETLNCLQAIGRVLAKDQVARINVPPADNSAMDGYAVRLADLSAGGGTQLRVAQTIAAGAVGEALNQGEAARIFTGAVIPLGADAVVMQENCERVEDNVLINSTPKKGENIRCTGEDIKQGETLLHKGDRLQAQSLGLAASVGLAELPVYRKLKVAIFSTGDELVMPGDSLKAGQIYNSNRYTLSGLLHGLPCELIDLGVVADSMDATVDAMRSAADQADVIITSGGVSVGDEDYVKSALQQLGQLEMWRVAMKPGKPVAYGRIGKTHFIGLPGNPVSVFATFCLFARPFLLKTMGMSKVLPKQYSAVAGFDWKKPGPRREFVRVQIDTTQQPNQLILFSKQGSGVLTSTVWADALAIIPENSVVHRGDWIDYIPLREVS